MRDLAGLPKAHLHLHLEFGMRPETLSDMATGYGLSVPTTRGYENFTAFSNMCLAATSVLRTQADWERLADEICADHAADGAAYLEPSFWAGGYRDRFGPDEATWEMVLGVFAEAGRRHGVCVRFMAAIDRVFDGPEESRAIAEMAVRLAPLGVVSLGLHNDEVGHPPGDFVEAFRIGREGGLMATPHAGELDGGHTVAEAIDLLGARRIQHGVRSPEVPGLVERLVDEGVCLDVCPTSNVMLAVVPNLEAHPLPALLDAGVRCSLNADDPLLFGPGLLDEYVLCRGVFGFDDERMAAIARTSIESGSAPDDVRATALASIDAWLAT